MDGALFWREDSSSSRCVDAQRVRRGLIEQTLGSLDWGLPVVGARRLSVPVQAKDDVAQVVGHDLIRSDLNWLVGEKRRGDWGRWNLEAGKEGAIQCLGSSFLFVCSCLSLAGTVLFHVKGSRLLFVSACFDFFFWSTSCPFTTYIQAGLVFFFFVVE